MLDQLRALVPDEPGLESRVHWFLNSAGFPDTAEHCAAVATESRRIAALFNIDQDFGWHGGLLHDISVVIQNDQRVAVAEAWGIELLPEERGFPMIIHQKLSVVIAEELFDVHDTAILSAIGCHTTLKSGASKLDKVVFVADKIAWDQPGDPPYLEKLLEALNDSLDAAALVYLSSLWQQQETLPVLHPWAAAAYQELANRIEP